MTERTHQALISDANKLEAAVEVLERHWPEDSIPEKLEARVYHAFITRGLAGAVRMLAEVLRAAEQNSAPGG